MAASILLVTGSDTGVGKTVLAARITAQLRARGIAAAALKPVSSGGRADARILRQAAGGVLALDEVNPWHFRAPVAPLLAARLERKRVRKRQVLAHIRRIARGFEVLIVEGAGGLLSPLGEDFDARDLIVALRAEPILVCPNRLGAVNQALLLFEALPRAAAARASLVLVAPPRPNRVARTNPGLLAERLGPGRIYLLPWLKLERPHYAAEPDRRFGIFSRWGAACRK